MRRVWLTCAIVTVIVLFLVGITILDYPSSTLTHVDPSNVQKVMFQPESNPMGDQFPAKSGSEANLVAQLNKWLATASVVSTKLPSWVKDNPVHMGNVSPNELVIYLHKPKWEQMVVRPAVKVMSEKNGSMTTQRFSVIPNQVEVVEWSDRVDKYTLVRSKALYDWLQGHSWEQFFTVPVGHSRE